VYTVVKLGTFTFTLHTVAYCRHYKAVIDRRLRPRCCHLGISYFKLSYARKVARASVGLQLVYLRTVYSQAQGCVCTALQMGGDEQPWFTSKYDVIHETGST